MFNLNPNSSIGFKDIAGQDIPTLTTFVRWNYPGATCQSYWRHDMCIFSLHDLFLIEDRSEFFVNKLDLGYDPITYQCMEENYDERVQSGDLASLNLRFYCEFMQTHSTQVNCTNLEI
jgi:hypothetical protein